ncbi:RecQ family ATP-dependent DNA helicase [Elizabethkingia meningoseptica]|uniref:RecQ family ATP-dependent DNA helicase n=1 Tax=Elizabethkingia meningoseptica TaxID=238 RepID=UPI00099AF182|nr:RecQ family ATP-dependent DNA helicase [Elizabethkingia meningoseptica]MEC4711466.1 RecQ family ATP-dependent DNA helicase [Elizabethkingia meningoseptica]OPC03094.1 recombinase RecQ [Elizabethkingia meningoseptica]
MISESFYNEEILDSTLKQFWGYNDFRDQQKEIIRSVLASQDTLALLPTGGGKSLCYQLPALLLEGTALVISPLLALMKEQVQELNARGIPAAYLSSEFDDEQEELIYQNLKNEEYKLLYVSPERLTNRSFLENITDTKLCFIAVDEAHCISEWGSDFRPSYQNIKDFRKDYPYLPCLALTATASVKVMQEIQQKLDFKTPNIYKKSYKRNNLYIQLRELSDKYNHILYYLRSNEKSGLIYVRTRKEAEYLSNWLKISGIEQVDFYHAGLPAKEKQIRQNYWLNQNNYTLVSTNAFGMGIDKDNVGFVIHLSPSPSIENYYQEIGRAGRNGQNAETILLWNKNELTQIDDLLKSQLASKTDYQKVCSYVYSFCQVAEHEQPDGFFEIQTGKIQGLTKVSRPKIVSILRFLHNQEIIYLKESKGLSSLELKFDISEVESLGKNDSFFIEKLARVLDGVATHRTYFRERKLVDKMSTDEQTIRMRLKELHGKGLVDYFDGNSAGIKFLTPRNDKELHYKYWNLFASIQKNKLQKWEEMKYFIQDTSYCKMRLILSYFGEKETDNCGKCSYCLSSNIKTGEKEYKKIIFEALMRAPMTLDELTIYLKFYPKDELLEHLKILLDKNQVRMLNYKTYTL